MANTSNPFGFRQFGRREGGAPTAGLETRLIASGNTNPIFTGDVVANSTASPGYIITIGATCAVTTQMQGVFFGCEYYNANVNRVTWSSYWPGSGATGDVKAYICTDPDQLYIAQGSTGTVLGTTMIGFGIPCSILLSTLGNTATGQSVMYLNSSNYTAFSSNAQFTLVGMYSDYAPPGVNGTSTGAEGMQIAVVQPLNTWRRAGLTNLST